MTQEAEQPSTQAAQDCRPSATQAAEESLARSNAYHKRALDADRAALATFNSSSNVYEREATP